MIDYSDKKVYYYNKIRQVGKISCLKSSKEVA